MHYLIMLAMNTLSLKLMLCNINIICIGFLLKRLRHLLNFGCKTYLGKNGSGIALNMLPLEVFFIAMVWPN